MNPFEKVIETTEEYVIVVREGRYIKIPLISEEQFTYEKEQFRKNDALRKLGLED